MVNLEHLQVIDTICAEGSFQKASEKLHKVRSAVSYSVKQVETYYDLQIFNRQTYRPELTADGKLLIVKIRQLLKQASDFETYVNELKGESETELRLGVSSNFPLDKITQLLLELKQDFPSTTIHLEIEVASGERMLLDEKVDIAIYGTPFKNKAVDYNLIDTMNIPLLISTQLPLDDTSHVTEDELANYPQVIVKSTDKRSPDTSIIDEALKWYVTDLHTKKTLITQGLGWGRLPEHMVKKELKSGELVSLNTLGDFKLPMYIAKLKNRALGPVALKIWNYFQ
ncbi:LysR family transcriptional regulator [Shewanella eurypsychrophilus]|uniref:LysR family transcriptional regulator n=1 Tax=Shewanella eurypsychrophilus TaxID=2593656 RepID=A0ABX6V5U6_9GAMM|nr:MULTISPECIES: LysR family transcriptional regulator [Shewanella]QFU21941.1 LysR family transcriptional regulator [Shewanella sp. YLB-09]QPG57230.1 LysR family transcriptional regulator [Shewanella eurypsychrophilus]